MENINCETQNSSICLEEAIRLLATGRICAFPTDTVYGLGARADMAEAIIKLFEAKNRPGNRSIIVLCADLAMAGELVEFSPRAIELAGYWPGALTLVLPIRHNAPIAKRALAVEDFLGVRVPASPEAGKLISGLGQAVATTSANISGRDSAVSAGQVMEQFAGAVPVLDGGQCTRGEPSTIVKVDGERVELLRAGPVPVDDIEQRLGIAVCIPG